MIKRTYLVLQSCHWLIEVELEEELIIQYKQLNQNKEVFEESVVSEKIQDDLKQ